MIPASLSSYNIYSGGSLAVDFDFEFPIDNDNDLIVMTIFGDDKSILTNDEDYTISGQTVTLSAPLLENQKLVLLSARQVQQQYDFYSSGKFDPQRYEDALDYTVSLIKQNERDIKRSIKLPYGIDNVDADMPLPSSGKLIKWNAEADKLENSTVDADELESIAKRLHASIDNIDTVAVNIDDVNTVADNIDIVNVVSSDIDNVSIVANNINSVNICAENIDAIIAAPDEAIAAAKSAEEAKTAAENIQNSLETISENKENIEKNASDISKNAENILKNKKEITANSNRMTTLEGKISTNENNITSIKTDIVEIKINVDDLKTDVSELQTDLSEVSNNVDANSEKIAQNLNKIAENKNLITLVQTEVTKIKTDTIPAIEANLTTAKNDILTNANNISVLQTDLSEVSNNVDANSEKIAQNISDIKILKNRTNYADIYHANALGYTNYAEYLSELKYNSFDSTKFNFRDWSNLSPDGGFVMNDKEVLEDSFTVDLAEFLKGKNNVKISFDMQLYEVGSGLSATAGKGAFLGANTAQNSGIIKTYWNGLGQTDVRFYLGGVATVTATVAVSSIKGVYNFVYTLTADSVTVEITAPNGKIYTATSERTEENVFSEDNCYLRFNYGYCWYARLNSLIVMTDGEEVFSGHKTGVDNIMCHGKMVQIPYYLTDSGTKIVDSKYRDRVNTLYKANFNNYYYTLDESDQTVAEVEYSGDKVAVTPFAINHANCYNNSSSIDLLDYEWTDNGVEQIKFKIGGDYPPLIATNANGQTFRIKETPEPFNPADYYWERSSEDYFDDIVYLDDTGLHVERNCLFDTTDSLDNLEDAINNGYTQIFLYTGAEPIKAYILKNGNMTEFKGVPLFSFRVDKTDEDDKYAFVAVSDALLEKIGNNNYNYNTNILRYGFVCPINNTVLNLEYPNFQYDGLEINLEEAVPYWTYKAKFNLEVRTSMNEEINVYLDSNAYNFDLNEERGEIKQILGRTVNGVLMTSFDADLNEPVLKLILETDSGETVYVDKVKLTVINAQQQEYRGYGYVWNNENEPITTDGSIIYTVSYDAEEGYFDHSACFNTLDASTEADILEDAGTLTIDWGDGTVEEFNGEEWTEFQHHDYSNEGDYTVRISNAGDHTYLQPHFRDCTELTSVHENAVANNGTGYVSYLFSGCKSLREIPQKLFSRKYADITDFYYCFANCTSLTEIPALLFSEAEKGKYFPGCFSGCTGLTNIPESLFGHLQITEYENNCFNFRSCFEGCNNIILNEKIFGEDKTFFKDANSVDFMYCFKIGPENRTTEEKGTAPDLWNWELPKDTSYYGCFAGHSAETLTNYDEIPDDWK